jgi:hypothetical protein
MEEKITLVKWDFDLARRFSQKFENLFALEDAIRFGGAQVYQAGDGELTVILKPERTAKRDGYELVWLASLGRNLNKHIPEFLKMAKRSNFKAIRFHCAEDEAAVVRLVRRHGAKKVESIYRYELGE